MEMVDLTKDDSADKTRLTSVDEADDCQQVAIDRLRRD